MKGRSRGDSEELIVGDFLLEGRHNTELWTLGPTTVALGLSKVKSTNLRPELKNVEL